MDPTSASAFLAQADIEPADLALWADFAHSARDSYGRKLVVRGPNFELMVMSWGPGDYSAIHDHGAADWGAVRYLGAADHATFHMQDGLLTIRERRTMELDDICTVDASLIHLMGNPTDTPFLTMHLYGRAHAAESITGGARVSSLQREIGRLETGSWVR